MIRPQKFFDVLNILLWLVEKRYRIPTFHCIWNDGIYMRIVGEKVSTFSTLDFLRE